MRLPCRLFLWLAVACLCAAGACAEGPVLAVDAGGNLHVNTTSSSTTVFVNGKRILDDISTLRALVSEQESAALDLAGTVSSLASQQNRLLSKLSICANVSFSEQRVISTSTNGAFSLFAADVDGDGDVDVLSASRNDDKIAWFENEDGLGTFSQQKVITTNADGTFAVYAADLDNDGDIDVLSASVNDNKIAWYENVDGYGTFSQQKVITNVTLGARSVFAADLDGDGDADVLSASFNDNKIAWYENLFGNGTFSQQKVITASADEAYAVLAADMDGDSDMDVLSISIGNDQIAWYENRFGNGTFSEAKVITTDADGPISVFAADLDGDGDTDVVSASSTNDKIAWYQNVDGQGTFSQQKVITTDASGAYSVFAADLDGDGDTDVLSASILDDKIAWYENEDGLGTFSSQNVITNRANGAAFVSAADLDGDGDMDVVSASTLDDKVAWHQNLCD